MGDRDSSPGEILSLPQGGGAVQGLGETFAPDLFTGTGNLTVPVALPGGRNGFQPELSLVYSSGNGNGPCGYGWDLSVPSVTRKTAKGIPTYDDATDVFILSGWEDLVPLEGLPETEYRPRTDSAFAKIRHLRSGDDDYWEVRSKDGLISRYGTPGTAGHDPAVVAKPGDLRRIFTWLLTVTEDPFGNRIEYGYELDSGDEDGHHWSQAYLSWIRYVDYGPSGDRRFLVRVQLAYEDRPDPFSSRRAGFEIRTRRRCQRVEVWTEAEVERKVSTYHLEYREEAEPSNGGSMLARVWVEGHDGAASEALPPIDFEYTAFEPTTRAFMPLSGKDRPSGSLAQADYELVDLYGEGLPGILEMNGTVRYWRNLGEGRLDLAHQLPTVPAGLSLADPTVQLLDANGDGRTDLMVSGPPLPGYYPLGANGVWDRRSFQAYRVAPSFDLKDPEVRLIDLDGDGVTDALRSGTRLECYFNDPLTGWSSTREVERRALDGFPNVSFSDPRVKLADMTGDNLQDIVLVYDGHVEYWPSLGCGNWGDRIVMRNGPRFPSGYDPKFILFGDVDGDGVDDLIYVGDRSVTLWLNQSGNGWSEPIVIGGTPSMNDANGVRIADLLGNGIGGVLWSTPADGLRRTNLAFLDLTGGVKPYLLFALRNNLGAETEIEYAPSTRYYLADQQRLATRWRTTLPFPVQVVARRVSRDLISGSTLTSEYTYHHGYWDGVEREFRGFGRVDQRDTQVLEHEPFYSPPVETRTWFHLGPIGDQFTWHAPDFEDEYWPGDPAYLTWPPIPSDLPSRGRRDALRALRGSPMRSEMYALDGSERQDRPYTVAEHSYGVRVDVPPGTGPAARPGVYFPYRCAQRSTDWERGTDPKTAASFVDDYDVYGQPRASSEIAVHRGRDYRQHEPELGRAYLATLTLTDYALRDDGDRYIVDRVSRATSFEIANDGTPSLLELHDLILGEPGLRSLIGQSVQFYDGEAFVGLPFGTIGDYGAPVRSEELAFTEEMLRAAYHGDGTLEIPPYLVTDGPPPWTSDYPQELRDGLPTLAGYTYHAEGEAPPYAAGYWVADERLRYDFQDGPGGRGLPVAVRDPLGHETTVTHDAYALFPATIRDAGGLTTLVSYDYRVFEPRERTDPNGNRMLYTFTPLGETASLAVMGKVGEEVGDTPQAPSTRWHYDYLAYLERGEPASVRTVLREYHVHDLSVPLPLRDQTIESVEYFDGFGRSVQRRSQGADVRFGDPDFGDHVIPVDQSLPGGQSVGRERPAQDPPWVVVTGWVVYDNKGRVVEQYEPFFAAGWEYGQPVLGRKVTLHYDPLGRPLRTVLANGAEQRIVYGVPVTIERPDEYEPTPWETYVYDANDNAGRTDPLGSESYEQHWNTPSSRTIDALGRQVETVERNSRDPDRWYTVQATYDITGNLLEIVDQLGRTAFRYRYDLQDRALRAEQIDAGLERLIYNAAGVQVERRDGKGALALHGYDSLERPCRLWARDRTSALTTLRERMVFGDDPDSGLTREQAAERNLLGRPYRQHDEAGLLTYEAYDFKGNIAAKARRVVDDASLAGRAANPAAWDASRLDETAYETAYTYDALNRPMTVEYPRDLDGERKVLRPGYNRGGELGSLRLDATVYVERMAYDARGQRTLVAYGNGVMTRYAYDPATVRPVRLRSEPYTLSPPLTYDPIGDAPLQDYGYHYDLIGNPLAIHDRTPGGGLPAHPDRLDREFSYDPLYRLLSAGGRECGTTEGPPWDDRPRCQDVAGTQAYREEYRCDPAGNLLEIRHLADQGGFTRTLALAAGRNQVVSLTVDGTVYEYAYDSTGNLAREGADRHFEWDYCDRLTAFRVQEESAPAPTSGAWYAYDAGSRRVKAVVQDSDGSIETTVYIDGIFEHRRRVQDGESAEQDLLHVVNLDQRAVLLRLGDPLDDEGPAVQYQLADQLGSSNVVLDEAGAWVNREEYTPYGETSFGSFAGKRYRYVGKELDAGSGLYYYGARYYAPWLGRWLSVDPLGAVDGLNLYAFVGCNPITNVDPNGTNSKTITPRSQPIPIFTLDKSKAEVFQLYNYVSSQDQAYYAELADRMSQAIHIDSNLMNQSSQAQFPADIQREVWDTLERYRGLHLGSVPALKQGWSELVEEYNGSKTGAQQYSALRSPGFSSVLNASPVINFKDSSWVRPPEVHHLIYKSIRPEYAVKPWNLMLATRGDSKVVGQHEGIFHLLGAAKTGNIYQNLVPATERLILSWAGQTPSFYTASIHVPPSSFATPVVANWSSSYASSLTQPTSTGLTASTPSITARIKNNQKGTRRGNKTSTLGINKSGKQRKGSRSSGRSNKRSRTG